MATLIEKLKESLTERYSRKRVMISYSGGLDSTLLAWFALSFGAEEVTLLNFDCGMENAPSQGDFYYDNSAPRDEVYDIDQYNQYARTLVDYAARNQVGTSGKINHVTVPSIPLNGLAVKPHLIAPSDNPDTIELEGHHGIKFYSGFVMLRLTSALSLAAAKGYDHVLTGHLGWNTHYEDESQEFVDNINALFASVYGPRLRHKSPTVQMPFRQAFDDQQVTKQTLIELNASLAKPYPSDLSVSCSAATLEYRAQAGITPYPTNFIWRPSDTEDGLYPILTHCGHCAHCLDRKQSFAAAGVNDLALFAK